MTINLLSILISLAMMLTGTYGAEQPDALAARTLTIGNICLEYNDEIIELTPALSLGAMSENGTAVYKLALECGDESLFPVQLAVTEDKVTAVAEKGGKAFSISNDTLNSLMASAGVDPSMLTEENIKAMIMEGADAEDAEIIDFVINKYLPAYIKLLTSAFDGDLQEQYNAAFEASLEENVDRGEGIESTVEYEGEEIAVMNYSYTIDNDLFFDLMEKAYNSNEALAEFYAVTNEMLTMASASEEEGAPEITSLKDFYASTGMSLTMEVVENIADDDSYSDAEIVMTYALPQESGMPPMEIIVNTCEAGEEETATVDVEYSVEGLNIFMAVAAYEAEASQNFEMNLEAIPEGADTSIVSMFIAASNYENENGGNDYDAYLSAAADGMGMEFAVEGASDGAGNASTAVSMGIDDLENTIGVSFEIGLSAEPFENLAAGMEAIELSENMDEATISQLESEGMTAVAPFIMDLQTLVEDESINQMIELFEAMEATEDVYEEYPEAEDNADDTYADDAEADADDAEADADEEAEAPALELKAPEFAWLPAGYSMTECEIDAEYGSVYAVISDEEDYNSIYVSIYNNPYAGSVAKYSLSEDGVMVPVEGTIVTIEGEEGSYYASLQEGLATISMSFYCDDMGIDTIGKIIAGMTY